MNTQQADALLATLTAEHGSSVVAALVAAAFRKDDTEAGNTYDEDNVEWLQVDALREWLGDFDQNVEDHL